MSYKLEFLYLDNEIIVSNTSKVKRGQTNKTVATIAQDNSIKYHDKKLPEHCKQLVINEANNRIK